MKIFVTGAGGYIGCILVPRLLQAGHSVVALDNFMYRQVTLLDCCNNPRFEVVCGDARNGDLIAKCMAQADAVIPLACLTGAPLCSRDPVGAQSIVVDGAREILKHRSRRQPIVYPTTNSGYGIGEKGKPCTEESPLRPISTYGVTKVKAEEAVLQRENSISFRLATVFGVSPRMRIDLLVNDFVYRAFNDRAVVIFEGHFKRNYIHLRDVVRVFVHGLDNFATMKGRPYNVGLDDANLSKLELCAVIKKHLPKFVFLEAPIGEDPDKRDYIVSNERIAATGFKPEWNLDRGIQELIKGFTILRNTLYSNV